MCMGTPLVDQERAIKKMTNKQGYIRVWKVVIKECKGFRPPCYNHCGSYKAGEHTAPNYAGQDVGWHCFRNKRSAQSWKQRGEIIIEYLAKPEWVKRFGRGSSNECTATFTKLFFPTYPIRKPSIIKFKKACMKG